MTVRDAYTHPIIDGDQLNDGYFNELATQLLALEATPTTPDTLAVAANKVSDYVIVVALVHSSISGAPPSGNSTITIDIGESGSETEKYNQIFHAYSDNTGSTSSQVAVPIVFVYQPTSDEKTNGFNVIIETTENSSTITRQGYWVFGR